MLQRIRDGRSDLVFDYIARGHAATSADEHGTRLIVWCAYYGDVSAVRFLLAHGESLESLGENLDLNGAVFHGHWPLCQFLVEHGAVDLIIDRREMRDKLANLLALLTRQASPDHQSRESPETESGIAE